MPLSELYRMSKGKVEGSQQKATTCSTDFVPDSELVELVWENGQVMMQGQSSRSRKTPKIPTSNNFNFQADRFHDKDTASQTTSKPGKYGTIESIYSNIAISVPSCETGLSQDDDMVPWFNYPIEDTLQQDYCPDFLPELSSVTVNEPSNRNSFASVEKKDRSNPIVRDSHNVSLHKGLSLGQGNASKLPSTSSAQLYPWSLQQGQTSVPSGVSSVSDIISTNTNNIHHDVSGNLVPAQAPASLFSHLKMQKQDSGLPRSNSSLLNFSHFSRTAAIARASIQNASNVSASVSLGADRMGETDKVVPAICENPAESRHLDPNCVLPKEMNFHTQTNLVSANVDLKPLETKPVDESHPGRQSDAVFREDGRKNDKSPNQDGVGSTAKGMPDKEKTAEHVGASSVCSGNSVERTSNDPTVNLKRKNCRYTEESEGQIEDVEEESVGVKKAAPARGGSGSKRSRAAEVHNLSERRRRDRINEKMRALQELIPNCNKVDKASMLDEAIEYLKTLQLQVQIMSMGAGLYMPPMMLTTGMQHIHAAHLPHFSPMSVGMGMGMGMGFGINMLDMNGGSHGCSMIPMPPMQRAHFPYPPIPGSSSFQGMAGANLQVFGHPSQGLPMSVAGAPMVPLSGQPPINSGTGMSALRMGVNVEASNAAPILDSKDLTQTTNSQVMHSVEASMSLNPQSGQFQETNEGFDQPALVPKNDQGPDGDGSAAVNSTKTNEAVPSREASCDQQPELNLMIKELEALQPKEINPASQV